MQLKTQHDVVVIGGGPAGSTIATLLTKQNPNFHLQFLILDF